MTETEWRRIFRAALKTGLTPVVKVDGTVEMVKSPTTTGNAANAAEAEREVVL